MAFWLAHQRNAELSVEHVATQIAMVAGEVSGDLLAGLLLDGVNKRFPHVSTVGIGGPQMAARGFTAWWPSDKLAVRGYVEVLKHYREIVGIRRQLKRRLIENPPALFLGVDAPDFNLQLERDLKLAGIKTVHFVCPSVWAWRAERLATIRQSVDHVLCIFPFEKDLLAQHGIAATYVGHPLAPVIPMKPDRAAAREVFGFAQEDRVVAILPGSRVSEVKYLASVFFQAAALIREALPGVKFIVPTPANLLDWVKAAHNGSGLKGQMAVVVGQSHQALAACDATLIASGTATLEAALFKRPMVIAYKMNPLSWQIMRRKKIQPWVGLPNILLGEFVVPELLQDQATPEALAGQMIAWLEQPELVRRLVARFDVLHRDLTRDTAQISTDAIQKILES